MTRLFKLNPKRRPPSGSPWRRVAWAPLLLATACFGQDIVVGQIGPFSGLPSPDALQISQGIEARFAQANAKGGIDGHRLVLFKLDDQFAPDVFVKMFAEAMKRKPIALLAPVGAPSLKRMLDDKLLDSADVVVLDSVPNLEALQRPGHPRLFQVRASDRQEIDRILKQAKTLGTTRMGVLYQNAAAGTAGFAMSQDAAAQLGGFTLIGEMSEPARAALDASARKVAASRPQSVLVAGTPRYMADAVAALRGAGVQTLIFALSYVPAELVYKSAGPEASRGVAITQVMPNTRNVALPLVRGLRQAMKANFPSVESFTPFHMEGYLSASVLVEALQRTRSLTPSGLSVSLRGMGDVDLGGFRVDFSRSNSGASFVDIGVIGADGRLKY